MTLSIIIPVWIINDELYELTSKTIQSLKSSDGYDCELIIVDNASPIGGDQCLNQADIYIRNKVNLGYPKAVNQGVKLASGDLLVIANNDIKLSPNWITATRQVFQELPKVGSLHFKMVMYDEPFNLGDKVWTKGKEKWCHGSFFVWRREAMLDIDGWKTDQKPYGLGGKGGAFDEGYGLGGYDDYDWQHRMRHLKGWQIAYTNGAAFQHKDSSTQNLLEQEARKTSDNKNREYFKKKFGEYPDVIWDKMYPEQKQIPWRPFP